MQQAKLTLLKGPFVWIIITFNIPCFADSQGSVMYKVSKVLEGVMDEDDAVKSIVDSRLESCCACGEVRLMVMVMGLTMVMRMMQRKPSWVASLSV